MRSFLIRLVINAAALAVTAWLLPGITIAENNFASVLLIALIFGLINALVKPIIVILSCPLMVLTLGLFYLVVNGLMLLLTDEIAGSRFEVDGIWWAMLGALVLGVVSSMLESLLSVDEDNEKPKALPSGS
jgi:putative membrane protein